MISIEKASASLMKQMNLNMIRRVMKQIGTGTKPQLANKTGLSVVTINSLVKHLVDSGELFEDKIQVSRGGRPALTYRFNYNYSLALVLHMVEEQGEDVIKASVVNLNEDILKQERSVYQEFNSSIVFQCIDPLLEQFEAIKVIGIGIPGQSVDGVITVTSHKPLYGVRLTEQLESAYGLPVIIENDVNAAISGYAYREQVPDDQCIVGIYFPEKYPPGMGTYLNGGIIKGKNGMAGEIKYLPIDIDWSKPIDAGAFNEIACRIMQSVNAVLAPDTIVIYKEHIDQEAFLTEWNSYLISHAIPTCPEVVLEPSVARDYADGLKWLALNELEPKYTELNE